jgi:hypothetical protein
LSSNARPFIARFIRIDCVRTKAFIAIDESTSGLLANSEVLSRSRNSSVALLAVFQSV